MQPESPAFETVNGCRYAVSTGQPTNLEDLFRQLAIDLAVYSALFVLTWTAILLLIGAALHGRIGFELAILIGLVVILGTHLLHIGRMVQKGSARKQTRLKAWFDAEPSAIGVPGTLTWFEKGIGHGHHGLATIDGADLIFRSPDFTVRLHSRDLVASGQPGTLEFLDPGFQRKVRIRFGGTGRDGRVTSQDSRRQIGPALETWRNWYSGEPSIFPPVRLFPLVLTRRTATLYIPLGLASLLAALALLDAAIRVLAPRGPLVSPTDYASLSAILAGAYALALGGGRFYNRRVAKHNAQLPALNAPAPRSVASEAEQIVSTAGGTPDR